MLFKDRLQLLLNITKEEKDMNDLEDSHPIKILLDKSACKRHAISATHFL